MQITPVEALAVGTRISVAGGYEAQIVAVGTIPDTAACPRYRGLPGYQVQWYAIDEYCRIGERCRFGDLEPLSESGSWMPQDHVQAVVA